MLSDFNLTDNVNRDIMKNVNFSAIYNEAGEVVDHAVPPVGEALMQLELRGEVTIQDLRMTARDYGDIVVDITVESHAPGFAARRYIIRKSMPETRVIVSEDVALSDLVVWPNVRLPKWKCYYTYFKQSNGGAGRNPLEMAAVGENDVRPASACASRSPPAAAWAKHLAGRALALLPQDRGLPRAAARGAVQRGLLLCRRRAV